MPHLFGLETETDFGLDCLATVTAKSEWKSEQKQMTESSRSTRLAVFLAARGGGYRRGRTPGPCLAGLTQPWSQPQCDSVLERIRDVRRGFRDSIEALSQLDSFLKLPNIRRLFCCLF